MNFGTENAGKLVYIDPAGDLIPLSLGSGIAIINDTLVLTPPTVLGVGKLGVITL